MKAYGRPLLLLIAAVLLTGGVNAKPWWVRGVESNENDFLNPDVAFRVSSRIDGDVVRIRWIIADGYYLYRQKMAVAAESPDLAVALPQFPPGAVRTDPYLGTQEIFTQQVEGSVAYTRHDGGAHPIQIKVTYQGCAEAGLCYPPISKVLFPGVAAAPAPISVNHPWEGYAALAGLLAFLVAGLLLKRGRKLASPA
jgi:thioredoxin:protein disulfide reductase